ncbi:MAG: thiamine-phosphate pyrophosphorylase [Lentimonas sp.]|jgi:thiamine-phosphate pyrophosphorylase
MFFFTNHAESDLFNVIAKLSKKTAIILREYHLADYKRVNLVKKIQAQGFKVLMSKSWKLAKISGADGVHFSDFDGRLGIPKNRGKMLISFSCHSLTSLKKAQKIKADLMFYSPVFATNSHPNQAAEGIFALRNFVRRSLIPAYALGGINEGNLKRLINSGIAGIGGISVFNDS